MVNWLSKVAPFVLDPNLAKPITRLSASWHEKLGLWLFPSMALEEIEFLIWGILRFNIIEAGGFLGGFGCGGSSWVFDIEQGGSSGDCTIWWSDDQKIRWFYYLMMIKWSDDCTNQLSQLWSPFWRGGGFCGLFGGWHGSWDDCNVLYHHQMISEDDQMVVLTDDLILTGTRISWPFWRMTWQLSWFERVADGHWMGGF